MNETLRFIIEFLITFVLVFLVYYFILLKQKQKVKEKKVPTEVNLMLRFHKIDLEMINYRDLLLSISGVTSFVISLILTVMVYFIKSNILIIIITLLISLPITLMFYDMIGRYFEKKSNEIVNEKKNNKSKKNENNSKKKG